MLRSTYKNHFGTSPTSTHPTELRDVLIDAGIDNQIQAGIDPLSIISDAHPEFANLLSVIDRDLVNDSSKKEKKPKTCHGCNTNTKLLSNPDGKFWCRSCFWERERLKQNNGTVGYNIATSPLAVESYPMEDDITPEKPQVDFERETKKKLTELEKQIADIYKSLSRIR